MLSWSNHISPDKNQSLSPLCSLTSFPPLPYLLPASVCPSRPDRQHHINVESENLWLVEKVAARKAAWLSSRSFQTPQTRWMTLQMIELYLNQRHQFAGICKPPKVTLRDWQRSLARRKDRPFVMFVMFVMLEKTTATYVPATKLPSGCRRCRCLAKADRPQEIRPELNLCREWTPVSESPDMSVHLQICNVRCRPCVCRHVGSGRGSWSWCRSEDVGDIVMRAKLKRTRSHLHSWCIFRQYCRYYGI